MAKMAYTNALAAKYIQLFSTLKPNHLAEKQLPHIVQHICDLKSHFEPVETATHCPWYVVGVICHMESSLDMSAGLHNGQPWNKRTTLVPRGKGPFKSWHDAAIDALEPKMDWLFPIIKQFNLPGICYFLERYNGPGYFYRGRNSDYLWGNSNHDDLGKFTRDGHFDYNHNGQQVGAMVILKHMEKQGQIEIPCAGGANESMGIPKGES